VFFITDKMLFSYLSCLLIMVLCWCANKKLLTHSLTLVLPPGDWFHRMFTLVLPPGDWFHRMFTLVLPPGDWFHLRFSRDCKCCVMTLSISFVLLLLLCYRLVVGFSERCRQPSVNAASCQRWLTWLLMVVTHSQLLRLSHALNRSWCYTPHSPSMHCLCSSYCYAAVEFLCVTHCSCTRQS